MELQVAQLVSPTAAVRNAVATDLSSLADLRGRAGSNSPEALKEVAQHFESLFVQMMTKAMRDATQEGGLFNSDEMKFHQDMFDQQISLHLSQNGGFGLAQVIERQLAGPQAATPRGELAPLSESRQSVVSVSPAPALDQRPDFAPQNPQQFIRELWPHADKAAQQLGVDAEVLVAQAALESGWGKYTIRDLDGRNSFNLFGIKADAQWQGDRATKVTLEYSDGIARKERASFRAYESLEQLFDDYVQFLQKPRYQGAREASSNEQFVQQLQQSGYATDPKYAEKITALMARDSFQTEVAQLKQQQKANVQSATGASLGTLAISGR
ncbi:flagellar assembly peptidoglycan hydrolase FlgJ [bacterium SCSIO 12696]|nr:flagellar assembly peptidoglycan hydrolase FlgJ [bacterium SCSIO 12696]